MGVFKDEDEYYDVSDDDERSDLFDFYNSSGAAKDSSDGRPFWLIDRNNGDHDTIAVSAGVLILHREYHPAQLWLPCVFAVFPVEQVLNPFSLIDRKETNHIRWLKNFKPTEMIKNRPYRLHATEGEPFLPLRELRDILSEYIHWGNRASLTRYVETRPDGSLYEGENCEKGWDDVLKWLDENCVYRFVVFDRVHSVLFEALEDYETFFLYRAMEGYPLSRPPHD